MMKPLIFIFTIYLFVNSIDAKLPSFIKLCGRRSADLDDCFHHNLKIVSKKLIDGIPESNVPSIEPLVVEGKKTFNVNGLQANFSNVKIYYLSTLKAEKLHVDLENKKINVEIHQDTVKLECDYEILAKIVIPINAKGSVTIIGNNPVLLFELGFALKNTTKGQLFYFSSAKTKLNMKDIQSQFIVSSHEGSDPSLDEMIQTVLNDNQKDIITPLIPSFEKAFSGEILKVANKFIGKAMYDDIFPDSE